VWVKLKIPLTGLGPKGEKFFRPFLVEGMNEKGYFPPQKLRDYQPVFLVSKRGTLSKFCCNRFLPCLPFPMKILSEPPGVLNAVEKFKPTNQGRKSWWVKINTKPGWLKCLS